MYPRATKPKVKTAIGEGFGRFQIARRYNAQQKRNVSKCTYTGLDSADSEAFVPLPGAVASMEINIQNMNCTCGL